MAAAVPSRDARAEVNPRRPATVAILSVITLGIYSLLWYYKINRDMRDFGARHGDRDLAKSKPWRSIIALTIGSLVIVPALVSVRRTIKRVQAIERIATGTAPPAAGLTACFAGSVLLPIAISATGVGALLVLARFVARIVAMALIQGRLNTAWRASGAIAERSRGATETAII